MPEKLLSDKVVAQIRTMIANVLAHPEEIDQSSWPEDVNELQTEGPSAGTTCGTSFCGAGHIIYARSPKAFKKLALDADNVDWKEKALAELGKPFNTYLAKVAESLRDDDNYGDPAWSLFGTISDWPKKFETMYRRAYNMRTARGQQRVKAKAFAARWEAFIASDGHDIEPDYYDKDKDKESK